MTMRVINFIFLLFLLLINSIIIIIIIIIINGETHCTAVEKMSHLQSN